MNLDQKTFKWFGLLILLPVVLAAFGGDRFRYPCQDPNNWDKQECQKPYCEVTRTCPEHIFKGGEGTPPKVLAESKPLEKGCK
jgi:hypothetical protein